MSFYAVAPDLARLFQTHRERRPAEAARPLVDAGPDQRPVTVLALTFGAPSVLSAMLPWP